MKKENRYYDISPRIVRAGQEAEIAIRPLFGHCSFTPESRYSLSLLPLESLAGQTGWQEPQALPFSLAEGVLRFRHHFDSEQEYAILLHRTNRGETRLEAEFRLYALAEDLYSRRPYKGDTHLHTYYSDGWEAPAYVAAACRKIGMDFAAITDHHQYAPSLEAIRTYETVPVDLRMYPGEEVHPPDNPVHIVNFGGSFSINELFKSDAYRNEVKAIEQRLTDLPAQVNRYALASCIWCFENIRVGNGLGIFCHPYWISNHRYDVPLYLTNLLFERQPFDALELIGGYFRPEIDSNTLQVARYQEERALGRRIPIVGASDSHGCERGELFGWYYTVVFAPSANLPDLIGSIKDLFSVAVEALPGEVGRAYGPFRLVKYTLFLMAEVFPQHDELCAEEGSWMLAYAAGDPQAAERLRLLQGQVRRFYDHLWGVA